MNSIALFSASMGCELGGAETHVRTLAAGLRKHLDDVRLITGRTRRGFTDDFTRLVADSSFSEYQFPMVGRHSRIASFVSASPLGRKLFPTDFESLSAFFAIPKIRAALTGCDLVEAHYPLDGLIFPFLPRSVKKVLHFHGSSPPPVFRRSWKLIRNHVDCSVACSEYAAGELQKVLDGAVIKVVYNGIDVDMFTPEGPVFFPEADYHPDRMKIGTVARLSRDKRHRSALRGSETAPGNSRAVSCRSV